MLSDVEVRREAQESMAAYGDRVVNLRVGRPVGAGPAGPSRRQLDYTDPPLPKHQGGSGFRPVRGPRKSDAGGGGVPPRHSDPC